MINQNFCKIIRSQSHHPHRIWIETFNDWNDMNKRKIHSITYFIVESSIKYGQMFWSCLSNQRWSFTFFCNPHAEKKKRKKRRNVWMTSLELFFFYPPEKCHIKTEEIHSEIILNHHRLNSFWNHLCEMVFTGDVISFETWCFYIRFA